MKGNGLNGQTRTKEESETVRKVRGKMKGSGLNGRTRTKEKSERVRKVRGKMKGNGLNGLTRTKKSPRESVKSEAEKIRMDLKQ